ncbi:hypothetical protein BC629DRAFT_1438710 [Irpex lacteus]|nr:hypothetical protein BC629DRAFT_1438710 [Irpex lacteus]
MPRLCQSSPYSTQLTSSIAELIVSSLGEIRRTTASFDALHKGTVHKHLRRSSFGIQEEHLLGMRSRTRQTKQGGDDYGAYQSGEVTSNACASELWWTQVELGIVQGLQSAQEKYYVRRTLVFALSYSSTEDAPSNLIPTYILAETMAYFARLSCEAKLLPEIVCMACLGRVEVHTHVQQTAYDVTVPLQEP